MQQYFYKAVSHTGTRVEGSVEAQNKEGAIGVLREKRLTIISLKSAEDNLWYKLQLSVTRMNSRDRVNFTRQLGTMIEAGLPLLTALSIIAKQASPYMVKMVNGTINEVKAGKSLHDALSNYARDFSNVYLALIRAGEVSGALGRVLNRLAKTLEEQAEFRAQIKAAMLYPSIILLTMFVVGTVMVFFVIPEMGVLYDQFGADVPALTTFVIGTSEMIRLYWYVFFLCLAGMVYLFVALIRSHEGKKLFDKVVLRIPYVGPLQEKIISTVILETLALLIKSGVPVIEAITIVSNISSNHVFKKGLINVSRHIEKGVPLATSFDYEKVFPEMVIQMIAVGEETGKLGPMVAKIARQYKKEAALALKSLVSVMEPLMIVLIGVGVGFLVLVILVPIYNLTTAF